MLNYSQKRLLCQEIAKNKDVLFGKYSNTVTKDSKHDKWADILTTLRSVGAPVESVAKLRDETWSNMKRTARVSRT